MRIKRENIHTGCSNLFDVSLKNFDSYSDIHVLKGHPYVETKKGYGPIVEAIIEKHREAFHKRVHLKHFLKKILLSNKLVVNETAHLFDKFDEHSMYTNDKNKAVLIICDETNPNEPKDFAIICDHVICTFSLGYLKENFNLLIEPLSLMSEERRLAVSRLGFGTINKIYLFYDEQFWNDSLDLVNIIWLPENEQFHVDKMIHHNSTKKNWYEDICKFHVVHTMPNALSGWIAGSEEFEKLDDDTIARECTRLLRIFLNNDKIPMPKSILRFV